MCVRACVCVCVCVCERAGGDECGVGWRDAGGGLLPGGHRPSLYNA